MPEFGFSSATGSLAFALALLAMPAPAQARTLVVAPAPTCIGAVEHPILARVEALDPVRRGATVRLRVTATSAVGLARAEARLVDAGAARPLGATRAALGPLDRRAERGATFVVVVPSGGQRALVQFKVEGEGPAGPLTRGVAINLLPDGLTQIGRAATAGDGSRLVEFGAQRVEP